MIDNDEATSSLHFSCVPLNISTYNSNKIEEIKPSTIKIEEKVASYYKIEEKKTL